LRQPENINSITKGEELFNQDLSRKKAALLDKMPNIVMNIQNMNGKVVGQQIEGDVINYNKKHQILCDIFESLEWNDENRERIEELEKIVKFNQKAFDDINLFINNLVKANATNASFISKLKNFAANMSTGISSSLIASAIFVALGK
jgi:hypothetical protein